MKKILVLGGTGFLGRHVCEKLARLQWRATVPTRRLSNAKAESILPLVYAEEANVHDEATLTRLVAGHDAVVNLVAILHGTQSAFDHVHVELPRKLVRACQAANVHRVVHVSALGADATGPSMYQRTKAAGEAVFAGSGLDVTVFRPSVMFGADDRFLNLFADLQTLFPAIPLARGHTRLQPVWVEDVADAIVHSLQHGHGDAPVYEGVGPEVFTLKELVALAGRLCGHSRPILTLPDVLGRMQARSMEFIPGNPLMSLDNFDSLKTDNVASGKLPTLEALDVKPSALTAVAPIFLSHRGSRAELLNMRRWSRL